MRAHYIGSSRDVVAGSFNLKSKAHLSNSRPNARYPTFMNPAYPGLAAAAFYLIGTITQITTLSRKTPVPRQRLLLIVTPAVVLHAITEYLVMNQAAGISLGITSLVSLIALTLALFVLVASIWQPLENLFLIVLPFAALAVAASLTAHGTIARTEFGDGLLAHVLISVV